MPEGPEVKFSTIRLNAELKNSKILNIKTLPTGRYNNKQIPGFSLYDTTSILEEVDCHGKLQWWKFNNDCYMLCTYGMSGQWSKICTKWAVAELVTSHDTFYFNDMRHFGTLKFVNKNDFNKKIKSLGLDPLKGHFESKAFIDLVLKKKKHKKPISDILMEQSICAGVGNYIRAEALWRCKISPWRTFESLSNVEVENLILQTNNVMYESFMSKGATLRSYRTPDGLPGDFYFRVYGRKEDEFGNEVITEQTNCKRTIHWAPAYQK